MKFSVSLKNKILLSALSLNSTLISMSQFSHDKMVVFADNVQNNKQNKEKIAEESTWKENIKKIKSVSLGAKSFYKKIPYQTMYRKDLSLKPGTTKIIQQGENTIASAKTENIMQRRDYLHIPVKIIVNSNSTLTIYSGEDKNYAQDGISFSKKAQAISLPSSGTLPDPTDIIKDIKVNDSDQKMVEWDANTKDQIVELQKRGNGELTGYINLILDEKFDYSQVKKTDNSKKGMPEIIGYNPGTHFDNPITINRVVNFVDLDNKPIGEQVKQTVEFGKGIKVDESGKSTKFDNSKEIQKMGSINVPKGYHLKSEDDKKYLDGTMVSVKCKSTALNIILEKDNIGQYAIDAKTSRLDSHSRNAAATTVNKGKTPVISDKKKVEGNNQGPSNPLQTSKHKYTSEVMLPQTGNETTPSNILLGEGLIELGLAGLGINLRKNY